MDYAANNERQNIYTHFAYISCCPKDAAWARWLKWKLQAYRLPVRVQRHHRNLPRRCSPISKSRHRMSSDAAETIRQSKFLIVICSRNANLDSAVLDEEVRIFLENGGSASNIFPFIVDTSRHPVDECFPKRLATLCESQNIIGANIYDDGRRTALMKLIAAMFSLKVEELEGAEIRRKKKQQMIAGTIAVLLAVAGIACWDYNRLRTSYYLDYTEVFGVPKGIGVLREAELRGKHRFYIVKHSQGLVRELMISTAPGDLLDRGLTDDADEKTEFYTLVKPEDGFSRAVYTYDENRKLQSASYYDENASLLLIKNYVNDETVDVTQYTENTLLPSLDIKRVLLKNDKNGYLTDMRYVDQRDSNRAVADGNGIYGLRFERDAAGRVIRKTNLINSSGNAELLSTYREDAGNDGLSASIYEYSEEGDLTALCFVDEENLPISSAAGYARLKLEYSAGHNPERLYFQDQDGKACLTEGGYSGIALTYGADGEVHTYRLLGPDGELLLGTDGYAGYEAAYTDGTRTSCTFFGLQNEPVINCEGYSSYTVQMTPNTLFITYHGIDGKTIINAAGYAAEMREYEDIEKTRLARVTYFDTAENPVLNREGVAGFVQTYDAWGCEKRRSYFGLDGEQVINLAGGYSSMEYGYNRYGLIERQSFYDEKGQPCLNSERYSFETREYDSRGNESVLCFFGADGDPIRTIYGEARTSLTWDNNGRLTDIQYYDERGTVLNKVCAAGFHMGDNPENQSLQSGIILVACGDWWYDGTAEDFPQNLEDEMSVRYLRFNEAERRYEEFQTDYRSIKTKYKLLLYKISNEEYNALMHAAQGDTDN